MNSPPFESAAEATLLRADAGGVATLTLNRPAQYNAINRAMLGELQIALDAIGQDDSVRIVVLAGAGRAFSPGHDLKEMLANSTEEFIGDLFRSCCEVMLTLRRLPQPVIARVHGIATAAGCQLVATCDLAIASEDCRFATSGVKYGLFCSTPGFAVARNVSRKHSMEMLLTGRFVDAATAERWGLINRAVPLASLDAEVMGLVNDLAKLSRYALRIGKEGFYKQVEATQSDAYQMMAEAISCNAVAPDGQEGIAAFVEKRQPVWRD